MRRQDREVTDLLEIKKIIEACQVLRLALKDDDGLYIVPLNFGFDDQEPWTFYFHSAKKGRKLSAIRKDPAVAFELDTAHRLIEAKTACGYGFAFDSVIGQGLAEIVNDPDEKKKGLTLLMKSQTGKDFTFTDKQAETVTVWKLTVTSLSAKRHE